MKKMVDLTFLEFYFHGLTGRADIDKEVTKYSSTNPDNEHQIKQIISERLKPAVEKYPAQFQMQMQNALSYSLTTNAIEFGSLYDSQLLPFDHPTDPRLFFVWLWEVFYENQSYLIPNSTDYNVIESNINDINDYFYSLQDQKKPLQ